MTRTTKTQPHSQPEQVNRGQLTTAVSQTLGLPDGVQLDPAVPFEDQLQLESARMIELAIMLEEDLDIPLPDDVDLRRESIASLHQRLLG